MRVLYVEDDDVDRRGLQRQVGQQGLEWDLVVADCWQAALPLVQLPGSYFDVAILDYQLGDGSGLDLLPHLGPTPAIVVTGQGSEQVAAEALRRGAADYVIKDEGYLGRLPLVAERVLDRRRMEEELDLALARLAGLEGKLPLCRNCHRAKSGDGSWRRLADLIRTAGPLVLLYQQCPDCRRKLIARRAGLSTLLPRPGVGVSMREAFAINYPEDDPVIRMQDDGYPPEAAEWRGERILITRLAEGLNFHLVAGPGWQGLYLEAGAGCGMQAASHAQVTAFLQSQKADPGVRRIIAECPRDGPPVTGRRLYPPSEWPAGVVFIGVD